jgi:hypothetical protein
MDLTLFKRSDADMVLATNDVDPSEMATRLSKDQYFTVRVVAIFPGLGYFLPILKQILWNKHIKDGWFDVNALVVGKTICGMIVECTDKGKLTAEQYMVFANQWHRTELANAASRREVAVEWPRSPKGPAKEWNTSEGGA